MALGGVGCGNDCELACAAASRRLDTCMEGWSTSWSDLGAEGRRDFEQQCLDDWDAVSSTLESRELQQALDACEAIVTELPSMSCDELQAIYVE